MSTVAEILTTLMVRAGLSDNELADRTGIPQPTISRIKNGNSRDPRDSTLRPLAEYFRLSVSQLRETCRCQRIGCVWRQTIKSSRWMRKLCTWRLRFNPCRLVNGALCRRWLTRFLNRKPVELK